MQFEAEKPAGGSFAALRQPGKDLVGVDSGVLANRQSGRTDKGNTSASSQTAGAQAKHKPRKISL